MTIKPPTCGRIVHLFNYRESVHDDPKKVPAIVQNDSMIPDLNVFTGNTTEPVVVLKKVVHKTETSSADQQYWDWPEIK